MFKIRLLKQVSSIEFEKLIKDLLGTLLDVRILKEFKNGHIDNARQLNYYALDFEQQRSRSVFYAKHK